MPAVTLNLPGYLVDKLHEKAAKGRFEFNDYVETTLYDAAFDEPNEETRKVMREVERGENVESGVIDTSSVDAMLKSFGL